MAFYDGEPLTEAGVAIGPLTLEDALAAPKSSDYAQDATSRLTAAVRDARSLVFGIEFRGVLVGYIQLHDIDAAADSSLVGYALFLVDSRGQGIGTVALRLLTKYVTVETQLQRLMALTTEDNFASLAIGRKNGFTEIGPTREDPDHGVAMEWQRLQPGHTE